MYENITSTETYAGLSKSQVSLHYWLPPALEKLAAFTFDNRMPCY
jgi:hypothetical protein